MSKDIDFIVGDNAAGALRGLVQRIERLEEEKAALVEDIKEVYEEAKGAGFDPTVMRKVVRLRKMDPKDRKAQQDLLEVYEAALGGKV